MTTDGGTGENPFGDGPFGSDAPDRGGGLLDSLRDSGEAVVSQELAGIQAALKAVSTFGESVGDADVEALRTEWTQIQADLQRALQAGLTAVEEGRSRRRQAVTADDVQALEAEIGRKNELIAQLSDSVKNLSRELDEKDRKLRDELRGLRDRAAEHEDEALRLSGRLAEAEGRAARQRAELDAALAVKDDLQRAVSRAAEAVEVERSHQDDRYQALATEMNDLRAQHSKIDGVKREGERRIADLDKRFQAAEKARQKAEGERDAQAQELSRVSQEMRSLGERFASLESEHAREAERAKDLSRRLRTAHRRLRTEGETFRSRVGEARTSLEAALAGLKSLPATGEGDEAEAAEDAEKG